MNRLTVRPVRACAAAAADLVRWIDERAVNPQRVSGVALRHSLPRKPNGKILEREPRVEYASPGATQRSMT
jgi:hypothetical protein